MTDGSSPEDKTPWTTPHLKVAGVHSTESAPSGQNDGVTGSTTTPGGS